MIEQKSSNKIVHELEDEEDGCFQHAVDEEELKQHLPTLAQRGILDEANPIYSGLAEPQSQETRVGLTLKVIPRLRDDLIQNYQSFTIGGDSPSTTKNHSHEQQSQNAEKKKAEELQKQLQNNIMFTSKQSPFSELYDPQQLVYQKIDNSRFNKFKDITYFTGLFVPKDNLIDSFKEKQIEAEVGGGTVQGKRYYGMCEIISKQMNKIAQKSKNKNVKKNIKPEPFVVNTFQKDTIIFDSNFQSGNLFAAFRTGKYSYELLASNDTNSRGTKQWFYFSMANIQPNINYRFTIINFNKKNSLFNHGLLPVIYSIKQNQGVQPHLWCENSGTMGWTRFGKDVSYYRGQILRENSFNKYYSALTFVINWKNTSDKIYIAHSYPYGYEKLVRLLDGLQIKNYGGGGGGGGDGKKSKLENQSITNRKGRISRAQVKVPVFSQQNIMKIKKLGKTIGNNWIYALQLRSKGLEIQKKEAIIIMARQHPGQTQGSFVCEGVIKKLIEEHTSKESSYLLKNYAIYIIPMINPDGVVHGHYRTNLCGKDLNRKWQDPETAGSATPQITIITKFLNELITIQKLNIRFILDLHGHSKKLNSFFYGNPFPEKPEVVKMYPYICSRLNQAVQYMDCTFSIDEYKKKAARIYLSSVLKQINVYTFESSFFGFNPRQNPNKVKEFTPQVYEKLGKTLIDALYVFLLNNAPKIKDISSSTNNSGSEINQEENPQNQEQNGSPVEQFTKNFYKEMKKQLIQNQRLLGVGDIESSGSESNPEEGQLNIEEIKIEIEEEVKEKEKQKVEGVESQANDERVIGLAKKSQDKKEKSTKSAKIKIGNPSSRKSANQIIEYKDFSRPVRNVKYLALSQVNAVLPDKYHISLQPMEAMAYRIGRKNDTEAQTEKIEKSLFKIYKAIEIEEKISLFGQAIPKSRSNNNNNKEEQISSQFRDDRYNKKSQQPHKSNLITPMFSSPTPAAGNSSQKPFHSKKHSEIIANIQKNKMKKQEELSLKFDIDDEVIKKRKNYRGTSSKQKYRTVFTQTMVSIKIVQTTGRNSQLKNPHKMTNHLAISPNNNAILQPIASRWGTLEPLQTSQAQSPRMKLITENQARISKMQKINQDVLKVYSRKSAMAEVGFSSKKNQQKLSNGQNGQMNIFTRKI